MGGDLKQCGGCSSISIILESEIRTDDKKYVPLTECPFAMDRWEQERFLVSDFSHYRNSHMRWPISEWPLWYEHAIMQLSRLVNQQEEKQLPGATHG